MPFWLLGNYTKLITNAIPTYVPHRFVLDLQQIIQYNARMEYIAKGWVTIKRHPFFETIDWSKLSEKRVKAPIAMQTIQESLDQTVERNISKGQQGSTRLERLESKKGKRFWKHISPEKEFKLCKRFDDAIHEKCPLVEGRVEKEDENKVASGGMAEQDPTNTFPAAVYNILYLQLNKHILFRRGNN